jgi:DNA-3-methyladenine glycosylase II
VASTRTFQITPTGAFSLAQANAFEFGPRDGEHGPWMSLAFAVDGDYRPAGVELTQSDDGVVHGTLHGDADLDAVKAQTARVLSLDHDGEAWERVLAAEPPLGRLAAQLPGLRPVLFHSPYEAAAWAIISARIHRAQGAKIRSALSAQLGTTYELRGETMHAFPSPQQLLEGLHGFDGLNDVKKERLLAVADAADDGRLDAAELQRLGPHAATERVLGLKGIGPFYASLIVIRGTGFADILAAEPRARARALAAYDLPESTSAADWEALGERWAPFRTWATVLCRVAHARGVR